LPRSSLCLVYFYHLIWYAYDMKTTIDKAGRVVIPAPLRALAGLRPGTPLEVVFDEGSIRLVRNVPGPKIERVGKLLLARPRAPSKDRPKVDAAKLVEEERNRWPW
jgi:AbrB family looped-hinge helix DNA binding protein